MAVLAHLIASHPQTPLSGAYSYAQWSLDTVTRLLSGNKTQPPRDGEQTIGLGSRLAVLDDLIPQRAQCFPQGGRECPKNGRCSSVSQYLYRVCRHRAARSDRGVRFAHRSSPSIFLTSRQKLVFIDDKRGGAQQRAGRVLPLVSGIAAFLEKRYLPHLRALAANWGDSRQPYHKTSSGLPTERPEANFHFSSSSMARVAGPRLRQRPFSATAHLNWPLPANLFRHRLPNRLRSLGVDPEIIDGLMGHGEWGSETWNHLSFRTWQDDAAAARPALEKAFKALRFHPLRGLEDATSQSPEASSPDIASLEPIRLFGAEARDLKDGGAIWRRCVVPGSPFVTICKGENWER